MKVVNLNKQSGFIIQKQSDVKFRTVDEFKGDLAVKCHQHIRDKEVSEKDTGLIEVRHRIKGKQLPLTSDELLHDMYTVCKGKREILVRLKVKNPNHPAW